MKDTDLLELVVDVIDAVEETIEIIDLDCVNLHPLVVFNIQFSVYYFFQVALVEILREVCSHFFEAPEAILNHACDEPLYSVRDYVFEICLLGFQ